jgi:hypothetical protein
MINFQTIRDQYIKSQGPNLILLKSLHQIYFKLLNFETKYKI